MRTLALSLCAMLALSTARKCDVPIPPCPPPSPCPTPTPCPECPPTPTPCPPAPEPTPTPSPTPTPGPPCAECPAGVENISVYVHAKGDAGGSSGQSWAAVLDATIKANGAWCRCALNRVHCPIPDRCVEEVSGPPVFESVRPLPGRETACLIIPSDNEWMPKVTGWCVMRIYAARQPTVRTLCEIDEAVEGAATCWQEE